MSLYEILCEEDVVQSINDNLEILLNYIPELKLIIGFEHRNKGHFLNVWDHTLLALSLSENNFDERLVLLLHDIGKSIAYQEKEDGTRSFHGHPQASAEIAYKILKRLDFSENYINKICYYIKNHDNVISDDLIQNNFEDALFLYKVQYCDSLAHNPDILEKKKKYLKRIKEKLKYKK